MSFYLFLWNAASLVSTKIIKLTKRRDIGERGVGEGRDGLEGKALQRLRLERESLMGYIFEDFFPSSDFSRIFSTYH